MMTDQLRTAALLRLVVQVIPQSFAPQLRIDIIVRYHIRHISRQLWWLITAFRFSGIQKTIYYTSAVPALS